MSQPCAGRRYCVTNPRRCHARTNAPAMGPGSRGAPPGRAPQRRAAPRVATAPGAHRGVARLPKEPGHGPRPPGASQNGETVPRPLWLPVSADVIELGKFDRPGHLRLRGFYTAAGLTVRVQPAKLTDPERDGIARCVAAARLIGAHRPDLMPRMLDHGTVARGRLGYLVEEAVAGTTPRGPRQVSAAMVRVATELFAIQQAIGIDSRRLSALAEPEFPARWRSVGAHGHVRDAGGARVG